MAGTMRAAYRTPPRQATRVSRSAPSSSPATTPACPLRVRRVQVERRASQAGVLLPRYQRQAMNCGLPRIGRGAGDRLRPASHQPQTGR